MNYFTWGIVVAIAASAVTVRCQPRFSDEQLAFSSSEAKKLIGEVQSGDGETALKDAVNLAKKHPDNLEIWMIVGSLHAEAGEYNDALAAFEKGIRNQPTDLPFLLVAARVHMTRGELGPSAAYVNGAVRFEPDKMSDTDRTAFKQHENAAAAAFLAKAIALRPTRTEYQTQQVSLLLQAKSAQAAFDATEQYLKTTPDSADLWLSRAQAAAALGRSTDAKSAAERCLSLNPNTGAAYEVLAEIARQTNDSNAADDYRRRAAFFEYIRPAYPAPYNTQNWNVIQTVDWSSSAGQHMSEGARKEKSAQARTAIDALIAQRTEESTRLLAAICWHHDYHGAVEDRIFAELEARKAEPTLRALLTDAQSVCTIGGCALALARLNSDEGFKLVIERLPVDRNTFPMNIPEALAIYGRPETVPVLAFALKDAITTLENDKDPGSNVMMEMGTGMFARRCIWALATFHQPDATSALEQAANSRRYRTDATAALFAQTRSPEYRARMLSELKKSPQQAEWIAARLKQQNVPESVDVAAIAVAYNAKKTSKR